MSFECGLSGGVALSVRAWSGACVGGRGLGRVGVAKGVDWLGSLESCLGGRGLGVAWRECAWWAWLRVRGRGLCVLGGRGFGSV